VCKVEKGQEIEMVYGIKTLDDFELKGKTVLCRVDINQPVDRQAGKLKSINRITACVPTIKEMLEAGAKVVLLAHQGSDIEYQNFYTTKPHSEVLAKLLGQEVKFIDDVCGPAARQEISRLEEGEVLLLDNVRFVAEEQTLFELKLLLSHQEQAETLLIRKLAPLGDLYVCDAFAAAHRDQPSLCAFQQVLPSAMGRLFEKEYEAVSKVMESPESPCVYVLGGAKISDAFMMLKTVLSRGIADKVLTGGLVANILLAATGAEIGKGSMDFIIKSNYEEWIEKARPLIEQYRDKIVLPKDLAYVEEGSRKEAKVGEIPTHAGLVDIGHETVEEYQKIIKSAKTICVNGPMGIFEEEITEYGTKKVWEALGNVEGYTLIGGGDSITATEKYGLKDKMSYICTAGGALIRFLSGEELPVIKALREAANRFV
jgi:phosphoglycerate kinase